MQIPYRFLLAVFAVTVAGFVTVQSTGEVSFFEWLRGQGMQTPSSVVPPLECNRKGQICGGTGYRGCCGALTCQLPWPSAPWGTCEDAPPPPPPVVVPPLPDVPLPVTPVVPPDVIPPSDPIEPPVMPPVVIPPEPISPVIPPPPLPDAPGIFTTISDTILQVIGNLDLPLTLPPPTPPRPSIIEDCEATGSAFWCSTAQANAWSNFRDGVCYFNALAQCQQEGGYFQQIDDDCTVSTSNGIFTCVATVRCPIFCIFSTPPAALPIHQ